MNFQNLDTIFPFFCFYVLFPLYLEYVPFPLICPIRKFALSQKAQIQNVKTCKIKFQPWGTTYNKFDLEKFHSSSQGYIKEQTNGEVTNDNSHLQIH